MLKLSKSTAPKKIVAIQGWTIAFMLYMKIIVGKLRGRAQENSNVFIVNFAGLIFELTFFQIQLSFYFYLSTMFSLLFNFLFYLK